MVTPLLLGSRDCKFESCHTDIDFGDDSPADEPKSAVRRYVPHKFRRVLDKNPFDYQQEVGGIVLLPEYSADTDKLVGSREQTDTFLLFIGDVAELVDASG